MAARRIKPTHDSEADGFEPKNTGKRPCEVRVGFFRKQTEERTVYFKSGAGRGQWLTSSRARVVK